MVVAFYIRDFALGGGSRAMYQLCLSMPNVKFHIFGKYGVMAADFVGLANVTLHYVNRWDCFVYAKTLKICKSLGVDLIHFHSFIPALYSLIFGAEKAIYTFHGIHYRKYDFLHSRAIKFIRFYLMLLLVKRMQGVVVLCNDDAQYLQNLFGNNILSNKIAVIPNAMKIPTCGSGYKFPQNKINLLVVARYDYQKGLDILLDLLKRMDESSVIKRFQIYFIGDKKVKKLLKENKSAFVEFLAETNQPYEYMKAADLLLLPSRWEGLPMVVLEALSLGTKVIAADTANVNYLADDKNLFVYRQFDANSFVETLQRAFASKDEPVNVDLSDFSASNVGKKTRMFYSQILGR